MLDGHLYVGAKRRESQSYFFGQDPSTGGPIQPPIGIAGKQDIHEACSLAGDAFDDFRNLAPEKRATFLKVVAEKMVGLETHILERAHLETRLPVGRLEMEFRRTVSQIQLFSDLILENDWIGPITEPAIPARLPTPRPDLRQRRIPIGPVAVFGSSNFPLAFTVAGGDAVSALAVGCPVIIKGHPAHPGTSAITASAVREAVKECGLHEGVFTLLQSPEISLGTALAAHPEIKAIAFTGSRGAGLALMDIAANRTEPIPVYAEMSSMNPVLIFPGALAARAEEIGKGYVTSLTTAGGQLCTKPGLVIAVQATGLDRFLSTVTEYLKTSEPQTMLTRQIFNNYDIGINHLCESDGITPLYVGQQDRKSNLARPAVFTTSGQYLIENREIVSEIFGATSIIALVSDVGEARRLLQSLEGQLAITIHVEDDDLESAQSFLDLLERKAGRIVANGWPTGIEVSKAIVHGGPFPATSDTRTTSVGTAAIERFLRPVCYQNLPQSLIPPVLRSAKT